MATMAHRIAILFPAPADPAQSSDLDKTRLAATAAALRAAGVEAVGAPYSDETADAVRAQLLRTDGVLVWVNPVERGRDRRVLDAMLEEVAAAGVFVSAHPAVTRKMGTKEVLYRTRAMGWGCDTRLYPTAAALRAELPQSLAAGGPRVLKQIRGNGGDGVWKVERAAPAPDAPLRIRHAKRGSIEETMPLAALLQRFAPYFAGGGQLIDQPYQPRLTDGMIRCYLVGDRVAGFGEQLVNALYPAAPGADPGTAPTPGPASTTRRHGPTSSRSSISWRRNGSPRCAARSRSTRPTCRSSGTRTFYMGRKTRRAPTLTCCARSTSARSIPSPTRRSGRWRRRCVRGWRREGKQTEMPQLRRLRPFRLS
jgi:hypothetical protein